MFSRYTQRTQRAIISAQEEARRLGYAFVGTEHLLLGLLCDTDSAAARALQPFGVVPESLRAEVETAVGRGEGSPTGEVGFSPRAKRVMVELAVQEAREIGHSYVGPEHLLLGLLRGHPAAHGG